MSSQTCSSSWLLFEHPLLGHPYQHIPTAEHIRQYALCYSFLPLRANKVVNSSGTDALRDHLPNCLDDPVADDRDLEHGRTAVDRPYCCPYCVSQESLDEPFVQQDGARNQAVHMFESDECMMVVKLIKSMSALATPRKRWNVWGTRRTDNDLLSSVRARQRPP